MTGNITYKVLKEDTGKACIPVYMGYEGDYKFTFHIAFYIYQPQLAPNFKPSTTGDMYALMVKNAGRVL